MKHYHYKLLNFKFYHKASIILIIIENNDYIYNFMESHYIFIPKVNWQLKIGSKLKSIAVSYIRNTTKNNVDLID